MRVHGGSGMSCMHTSQSTSISRFLYQPQRLSLANLKVELLDRTSALKTANDTFEHSELSSTSRR